MFKITWRKTGDIAQNRHVKETESLLFTADWTHGFQRHTEWGKNGSLFALPFVSETLAQKDPIGTYVYEAVSAPGKCALLNHAWSDSLYRTGNAEPETDIKQRTICCPYVEWRRRKRWASRLEATWGDSAAWKLSFHSLKNPSNKRVLFTRGSTS